MTQDEILVNDIYKRNWLSELQQLKNKIIVLVVGDGQYHLQCKQSVVTPFDRNKRIYEPKEQYSHFLDWYQKNNMWCPVVIDGCDNIYDLAFFTCGAHCVQSLNLPVDLKLYLEYQTLPLWDMPQCHFYLYCDATDNISWSDVDTAFTIYFSEGARALEVLNQISDKQFPNIHWKFRAPAEMNDEDANNLAKFMETIMTRARKIYNKAQFANWIIGTEHDEPFSPFCYGEQEIHGQLNSLPCYFHLKFTISLFDMGIYLCPGLYNNELKMGNLNFDDNPTITNVNAPLWIFKDHIRQNTCIGCDTCEANKVCTLPCLTQGYEDTLLLGCVSNNLPLHERLRACYAKFVHLITQEEWDEIFSICTIPHYKEYIKWLGEQIDVREYSKY